MDAARQALQTAEPLIPRFGRSAEAQPRVLELVRELSRTDGLAMRLDAAAGRLDALTAFFRTTEEWWGLELPRVLPGLVQEVPSKEIYSEALGLVEHERHHVRRMQAVIVADIDPTAAKQAEREAIRDAELALSEFVFPSERIAVAADLARAYAEGGQVERGLRVLATSAGLDADWWIANITEARPCGRGSPLPRPLLT